MAYGNKGTQGTAQCRGEGTTEKGQGGEESHLGKSLTWDLHTYLDRRGKVAIVTRAVFCCFFVCLFAKGSQTEANYFKICIGRIQALSFSSSALVL